MLGAISLESAHSNSTGIRTRRGSCDGSILRLPWRKLSHFRHNHPAPRRVETLGTTAMTKSNQPVASFGAEIQSTLRAGAERELRLKFSHRNLAIRFGQRINALRAAMRREDHPDWHQLYRCGVHHDPDDPRILIIAPKDSEFRAALQAAG